MKRKYSIVIDTNVIVSALNSKQGASFKLLSLIDQDKFIYNISVPLIFEYEYAAIKEKGRSKLSKNDIEGIIDHLCEFGIESKPFYLWRPFLKDPNDDFVLELAVESKSEYIVTYNINDFKGIREFGIEAIRPKDFLGKIGETS